MFKPKIILITVLTLISILFLAGSAQALPNAPTSFTAQNLKGPIYLSWTASTGGVGSLTYTVYRSTDVLTVDPPVKPYGAYSIVGTGISATSFTDTSVTDGTAYYYFATATDTIGQSATGSLSSSATSDFNSGKDYVLTAIASNSLIDYENSTIVGAPTNTVITYQLPIDPNTGQRLIAAQVDYDIIDDFTSSSIYKEPPEIISGVGGVSQGTITWNGSWFNTVQPTKHDGSYTVKIWSIDFAGNPGPIYSITINVHVVHVNNVIQAFTDFGTTTIAHSLPINISYQLTQAAWTTISIYNTNGTNDTSDDTLIKSFTFKSPRNGEGADRTFTEYQSWDGTDSNNKLVPSGIYRFAIDAYFDHSGVATRDTANSRGWEFALDKRIVDINTTAITATNALSEIKYVLSEPASVKIKICKSGTTFSTDATTGEAVPSPAANLVKTFTFNQQNSGVQDVTWDGNDEGGKAQDNGLYLVVITAKDVEGNLFFNTSGTDNLFRTTISIDKTASQVATDSTAPTIVSTVPANGDTLSASFTQISAKLADNSGGSGVDLDNSAIILSDPAGNNVTGTQTNDAVDTIILTVPAQSTNGTYTIRVTPKDKAGNTAAQSTITFTLNSSAEDVNFKDNVFVYPNPITNRNATFSYNLASAATVTLEVYTLIGEKVFSRVISNPTGGTNTITWNCTNNDGEVLANDVYLYRIKAEYSSGNTREAVKKMIILK